MVGRIGIRLLIVVPTLFLGGCSDGPETYPVRGLVQFTDGKLLQQGVVEFSTGSDFDSVTARGRIAPDGSFTLGTYDVDDGAVPGSHRVVVISDHVIGNGTERPGLIEQSRVHPKHRLYRTSELEFTVEAKENEFIVQVEYAPLEEEDEPGEDG